MVIALAAFEVEGSQLDMEVSIPLLSARVRTWSKTHSMARPISFSNRDVGLVKGEVYCFFVIERLPKSKML